MPTITMLSPEQIEKILFVVGILTIIATFFFLIIYYLTVVNSNNYFAISLQQSASKQYTNK